MSIKHQVQPTTPPTSADALRRLQLGLEAQITAAGASGVTTFNNRSGAVSLTTNDVTLALTFTPQPAGTYASGTGSASGTNTGDETKATIDTKIGATGGTTNFYRQDGTFAAPPSGSTNKAYCKVTGSGFQSLVSGSAATLTWDTETYDVQNMHDNATNSDRIVVPFTGWYDVKAHVKISEHTGGFRFLQIQKNNLDVTPEYVAWPGGGTHASVQLEERLQATAGDFFTVRAFQNSSAALDARKLNSFFSVAYVGGL